MKRLYILPVVAVALSACADDPSQPSVPGNPQFSEAAVEETYLVVFKGNGVPANFEATVAAAGGEVVFAHAGAGIAAVSGLVPSEAAAIAASRDVAGVELDAYTELDVPAAVDAEGISAEAVQSPTNPATAFFYPRQWHMRAINANGAWAAGKLGSPSIAVGILDTGVDYISPDLVGRVDLARSRSFLSAAENARVQAAFPGAHPIADLHYHGTHVASTVVSNGIVNAGVTSQIKVVGLKVCAPGVAPSWRGTCPTSGTLSAILYAADNGIPIINMSLGGGFLRQNASAQGGFGPSFLAVINRVFNYANAAGTVVVVSAGNSAWDLDHFTNLYASYCDAPHVVCVSATGPTAQAGTNGPWTNIDALATYSNFGRSAISVAAPGGNRSSSVWATCSRFSLAIPVCRTGNFTVGLQGTSMAAPHTSGVAALIASEGVSGASAIRARLQQTSDDLGPDGTDPAYGKGRINAARAAGAL